jgi:glycerol kinase
MTVSAPRRSAAFLVIDVGTSSVRVAALDDEAATVVERQQETLPATPAPGLVELDASRLATVALDLAAQVIAEAGPVAGVGIANQRGTTIVWDRATGEPVGPGIGWQDLRTVGDCLTLRADGLRLAPNQSATKVAHLLDAHDPDRSRDLRFGTVDTWIAWRLSQGEAHVTDPSNAGITGLLLLDGSGWDTAVAERLRIPEAMLPRLVDSTGEIAAASALPGAPPILGIVGDQQASLVGQGCVRPGLAKITFGTGAMLDLLLGDERPEFETRGKGGTYPIIGWRQAGGITWGLEAVMLSAGTNVEWLRDDLGLIDRVEDSHDVAAACTTTDGVVYVPALLGLGTPHWDYGARGALLGITRGTGRPEIVRAVLEGVAQRGADLVAAVETDAGRAVPSLRIDGGMSRNPTFVQALADAAQRPVEVSPVVEATARGAALLAGLAHGTWGSWDDVAATWRPAQVIEPGPPLDRDRWARAVERAAAWYPELTGLDF